MYAQYIRLGMTNTVQVQVVFTR